MLYYNGLAPTGFVDDESYKTISPPREGVAKKNILSGQIRE